MNLLVSIPLVLVLAICFAGCYLAITIKNDLKRIDPERRGDR